MKKSKFTESQIIKILNEFESKRSVKDIYREYGIATLTFYSWKRKYKVMN